MRIRVGSMVVSTPRLLFGPVRIQECMEMDTEAPRKITLLDSLEDEWVKLSYAVMRDCGPAAQTLGGLLKITNRTTFVAQREISDSARLPPRTVRRHLAQLAERGWISNRGREKTQTGWQRRTSTIVIPKTTRDAMTSFGILPWWACKAIWLPWSAKAVFSIVVARMAAIRAVAVENDTLDDIQDIAANSIHFDLSLRRLQTITGLTRESIVAAKRHLAEHRMIEWTAGPPDSITPDWGFHVTITPTTGGTCYMEVGWSDSGL